MIKYEILHWFNKFNEMHLTNVAEEPIPSQIKINLGLQVLKTKNPGGHVTGIFVSSHIKPMVQFEY